MPWNGRYVTASGNLPADFHANVTAEAQGRVQPPGCGTCPTVLMQTKAAGSARCRTVATRVGSWPMLKDAIDPDKP